GYCPCGQSWVQKTAPNRAARAEELRRFGLVHYFEVAANVCAVAFTLRLRHARSSLRSLINTRRHLRGTHIPRLHSNTSTVLMGCKRPSIGGLINSAVR